MRPAKIESGREASGERLRPRIWGISPHDRVTRRMRVVEVEPKRRRTSEECRKAENEDEKD